MGASMEQPTSCHNVRTPKINVTCRDPQHHPQEGTVSSHTFSGHRPLHRLWETWLTITQNHWMRRRPHHMELNKSTDNDYASHGPLPHTSRMENSTDLSFLATSEIRCIRMNNSAHMVAERMQTQKTLPLRLNNFLWRASWKAYNQTSRWDTSGNQLNIL